MEVFVSTRNIGKPGATFRLIVGDFETPRMSVATARRAMLVLEQAIKNHYEEQNKDAT